MVKVAGQSIWRALFMLLILLASVNAKAQERCGFNEYQEFLKSKGADIQPAEQFEQWLIEKRNEKVLNNNLGIERLTQGIYTIPVVVHIIHNGEALGTGSNLSVQQVISQIEVLTEDFRRQNTDAILTPAEFLPVAVDTEIEFVLAKQDPDGLATNGITRRKGPQSSYNPSSEEMLVKELDYWPAEDYLNIWVAPLSPTFLGYSSFPSSSLPGILNPELNRLYDGVIVDYRVFGSIDKYPPANLHNNFDKGRTTTHEIGHFLGLRHIWGDGGCEADDFCMDTPNQQSPTNGCPGSSFSCSSNDMYQNYLDYTDDRCMNIFTSCQKDRMRIVLENSPRRLSLLTSHGLQEPMPIDVDISISQITAPSIGECDLTITPSIIITNAGNNQIDETVIKLSVNGVELESKTFPLSLTQGSSTEIFFSQANLTNRGESTFTFEVQTVNGIQDLNEFNNSKSINTFIAHNLTLPAIEIFDVLPSTWNLINIDDSYTWEISNAGSIISSNTAAKINFFDYEEKGQQDYLVTPLIDLSDATSANLIFDRAYAMYPNVGEDNLKVAVSLDCGTTFPFIIFNRNSSGLQTTTPTSLPFIPTSINEWQKNIVDLSAFLGLSDLQIAFIATNGFGNNLYLDNIRILKSPIPDLAISQIISPDPISCSSASIPSLLVTNSGTVTINNVTASVSSAGNLLTTKSFTGLNITPGNQKTLTLDAITINPGSNLLNFQVDLDQGLDDFFPFDNFANQNFVVVTQQEVVPARQQFLDPDNIGNWIISNSQGNKFWELETAIAKSQGNLAASVKVWNNPEIGAKTSLISPILDFSLAQEASVFFRVSYGSITGKNDVLRIKASTDCGNSFTQIYEKGGEELGIRTTQTEWFPQSDLDWINEYLNLNQFVGEREVIFAFEFIDGGGNNIFLDDIEFFISDDPYPVYIAEGWLTYPNPAVDGKFDITLNFSEKQEFVITIINSRGQVLFQNILLNGLNQTIPVDLSQQPQGLYFVQIRSETINESRKMIIKP